MTMDGPSGMETPVAGLSRLRLVVALKVRPSPSPCQLQGALELAQCAAQRIAKTQPARQQLERPRVVVSLAHAAFEQRGIERIVADAGAEGRHVQAQLMLASADRRQP